MPFFSHYTFLLTVAIELLTLAAGFICTFRLMLVLIFSDARPRGLLIQSVCCLAGMLGSVFLFYFILSKF